MTLAITPYVWISGPNGEEFPLACKGYYVNDLSEVTHQDFTARNVGGGETVYYRHGWSVGNWDMPDQVEP